MQQRPQRLRIKTELGKLQTPPDGASQYHSEGHGEAVLLLGVGPEPADALAAVEHHAPQGGKAVYVMEAPQFKAQMPVSWDEALPGGWTFVSPEELTDALLQDCQRIVYRPGIRFFPHFWGPVLGRCRRHWAAAPSDARSVLLPAGQYGLLNNEISQALEQAGYTVHQFEPAKALELVPAMLARELPSLYLSVNFNGLDPYGELYHLLEASGVPVCVWCVDNPWHLLSGLRAPFWQRPTLAVTDASFIPGLSQHGAADVLHLPLGTDPDLFSPDCQGPDDIGDRLVFVGRSEFPGKSKFFAGCKVPRWQTQAADTLLAQGGRPDWAWWAQRLEVETLWPGTQVRCIGLGAETSSRDQRTACLQAALETGLTVYGDDGWRGQLPDDADIREPVDYYDGLCGIYANAGWTLNATSLLLPAGLTQRHFDVWAAGGLLLSDATPGLEIFPSELVHPITFDHPNEIPGLAKRLAPGTPLRDDLRRAWRELILSEHTYTARIATLLEHLQL